MEERWQLYDEQGRPLLGKGASKDEVYGKALLHAASHVWIWRQSNDDVKILLQKRASNKRTWPDRYDISAAGHIDLGEDQLQAAIRESKEEIGYSPDVFNLEFIGTHRCFVVGPGKAWVENEIRFLYLLQVTQDTSFSFQDGEVGSVEWRSARSIKDELGDETLCREYVPHGDAYFAMLFEALDRIAKFNHT